LPRRQFLDWLLGGSVGVWAAAVAAPLLQYLTPLQEAEHTSEIELSQGDKGRVANDGFAIVRFGQERVIVFQDASGQLRALSAKCTHEGCTVTYRSDEQIVWCACHNGRFDRDGLNIAGPPPRPLTPYKVVGKLAGKVLISPKEA
jgi:Rieske Fe-S protein